jgi:hypothetical protein
MMAIPAMIWFDNAPQLPWFLFPLSWGVAWMELRLDLGRDQASGGSPEGAPFCRKDQQHRAGQQLRPG